MLFAALIVAGDSLQIDSGLPAASINILTGLILIAVLGWTTVKSKKGA
jgi:simple sugar transport system permease protein